MIHAASHFYHEKRVAWVSISMHGYDPVPLVMGLRLAVLRAPGAPLSDILVTSSSSPKALFASLSRRSLGERNGGLLGHSIFELILFHVDWPFKNKEILNGMFARIEIVVARRVLKWKTI